MPGWQAAVEPFVKAGKLVAIGIMQDQHADRCRLYRQYRQITWPLYIDAINIRDHSGVPIPVGIDESGIVRLTGRVSRDAVKAFVENDYPKARIPAGTNVTRKPDPKRVRHPRERGDAIFLYDEKEDAMDRAIQAYRQAIKAGPKDSKAHFRLGVAYRRRYDSPRRKPDDAQKAVDSWGNALSLRPNWYIWRRRIQQYGPRLDKPYNFFFWVVEARKAILARGEKPVELVAEPMGSEIAPPSRGSNAKSPTLPDPDPKAKITADRGRYVGIETAVTPALVRPGHSVRVRVTFRLSETTRPWWNNESDPLTLTVRLPKGITLAEGTFTYPAPPKDETQELRVLEFEAAVDASVKPGTVIIPGYAAYGVCEDVSGVCMYRRQDLKIAVRVDARAPKIQ